MKQRTDTTISAATDVDLGIKNFLDVFRSLPNALGICIEFQLSSENFVNLLRSSLRTNCETLRQSFGASVLPKAISLNRSRYLRCKLRRKLLIARLTIS